MENRTLTEERVFGLATYLLTSARGCIDEPRLYGPLRLVEAVSRLISLAEGADGSTRDEFLFRAKDKIDANKHLVMESEERFVKFLDDLLVEFTQELKKRSGIGWQLRGSGPLGRDPRQLRRLGRRRRESCSAPG